MNETLSLSIVSKVSGQSDVDRLDQSLVRVGASSAVASRQSAEFAQQQSANAQAVNAHTQALVLAEKALLEVIAVAGTATRIYVEHQAATEVLANTYRGLRLALSPSLFTASTLAVGILAEQSLKLAYNTAAVAEKQALLSASSKVSFQDVQALAVASRLAGQESDHYLGIVTALQARLGDSSQAKVAKSAIRDLGVETEDALGNTRTAAELVTELGRSFGAIKDPVEKAQAAIAIFGKDNAGAAIQGVNERFAETVRSATELGVTLSREEATNLSRFKSTLTGIGDAFRSIKTDGQLFIDFLETRFAVGVANAIAAGKRLAFAFPVPANGIPSSPFQLPNQGPQVGLQQTATNSLTGLPGVPTREQFTQDAIKSLRGQIAQNQPSTLVAFRTLGLIDQKNAVGTGLTGSQAAARAVEAANAALNAQATGEDGLNRRLSDAVSRRQKLTDLFIEAQQKLRDAPGDVNSEAKVTFLGQQIVQQDRLVRSLEAQKKATDDLKEANQLVEAAEKRANEVGLDEGERVQQRRIEAINDLSKLVSGNAFTDRAKRINEAFDKEGQDVARKQVERQQQLINDFANFTEKSAGDRQFGLLKALYGLPLAEQFKAFKENLEAQKAELDIALSAQRQETTSRANRTIRLAELQAQTPGQEVNAVKIGYQERIRLALDLYNIEKQRADQAETEKERRIANARAEADLSKQIADARLDAEVRLAELQKQRIDRLRADAGSLFDATVAGKGNIQDFILGQAKLQGRTIFQNAAVEIGKNTTGKLSLPGQGTADNPNAFGRLLSGTIFGLDPLKAATDLNTTATVANTAALNKVSTSILTGGSGVGSRGVGLPGGLFGGVGTNGISTFDNITSSRLGDLGIQNASFATGFSLEAPLSTRSGDLALQNASLVTGINFGKGGSTGNSVLQGVGLAGGVAAGVFGAVNGFSRGGASGILQGTGSVLGTAALLDPEPISKAVLGIAALGTGILSAFFGSSKKKFEETLNRDLQGRKYNEPQSISVSTSSTGNEVDRDFLGNLRVLKTSPRITDANRIVGFDQFDPNRVLTEPTRRIESAAPTTIIAPVTVHTMDSRSFRDNASKIGDALYDALQTNHPVRGAIQNTVLPAF